MSYLNKKRAVSKRYKDGALQAACGDGMKLIEDCERLLSEVERAVNV